MRMYVFNRNTMDMASFEYDDDDDLRKFQDNIFSSSDPSMFIFLTPEEFREIREWKP